MKVCKHNMQIFFGKGVGGVGESIKKDMCNTFGQMWYMPASHMLIMQFCIVCCNIHGHRLKYKALLKKRRKTVNTTIHPQETTVTIELPSTYSNENM